MLIDISIFYGCVRILGGTLNLFAATSEKNESLEELIALGFQKITVPTKGFEELPISDGIANPEGDPITVVTIDGHAMYLQNVEGMGNDCFFNAMGLDRDGAVSYLLTNRTHRFVRLAVVNEIVSSLEHPEQLPELVKVLIDYNGYKKQYDELSALEKEKADYESTLLEITGSIQQQEKVSGIADEHLYETLSAITTQLALEKYKNLTQKHEALLQVVRLKASSLEAFKAYIHEYVDNGQMMVCLPQVQGDDIGLLTVIDAIAYLYDTGIRVYTQDEKSGMLRLTHSFIHADSKNVKYIFHEGFHFMSFIPIPGKKEEETKAEDLTHP